MENIKMLKYSEGSIILREGELKPELFKIVKGNAEVYVGYGTKNETLIAIIGEKDCFGELGLLLNEPAVYTVVAYNEMVVLRIMKEDLAVFVKENYTNIINIMKNMARTMVTMRTHINLLLIEIKEGKKPKEELIVGARKAMFGYDRYRSIQEAVDKFL